MAAWGLVEICNWQLHQLNPEMFDHVSWLEGLVDIYNWQLHQLNPKMFDHVSWMWKALVPIQFIPFWGIGFIWGLLVGLILLGKCSRGKIHCLGCRLNLTLLGSIIVLSCFQTNNPLQLNCKLSTSIYFGSFMQLSCHHMGLILYDNKFLRAERVRQIKHFNEDRLTPGNLPGEFCNGTRWNGFATESLSHHSLPLFAIVRVLSVCDEQFGFADCCINMFGWFMKGPSCWLEVICLALMMFNWRWSTTFAQGCSPEHQSKTFVFELGVICGLLAGALTTCLIHMHSAIVCNVIHCSGISWCRGGAPCEERYAQTCLEQEAKGLREWQACNPSCLLAGPTFDVRHSLEGVCCYNNDRHFMNVVCVSVQLGFGSDLRSLFKDDMGNVEEVAVALGWTKQFQQKKRPGHTTVSQFTAWKCILLNCKVGNYFFLCGLLHAHECFCRPGQMDPEVNLSQPPPYSATKLPLGSLFTIIGCFSSHTMVSFCWLFEVWVQLDTECNPTWLTNGCFGGLEDGWQHQCVQQGQEHCPNAWASFVTCNIHLQGPGVPHVHASHWQVCWDTCFGFGMG